MQSKPAETAVVQRIRTLPRGHRGIIVAVASKVPLMKSSPVVLLLLPMLALVVANTPGNSRGPVSMAITTLVDRPAKEKRAKAVPVAKEKQTVRVVRECLVVPAAIAVAVLGTLVVP
jgi:hypothetical protein